MTRRLRIAHLIVQPVLVWDDGDELTPGPAAKPLTVPLSQLTALADRLPGEVARLQAQSEQPDEEVTQP